MNFFRKTFHYKELDSSSTFIKRRRSFLKNLSFVSCDFQTNGHGRLGRTWHSEKGENLLFSFIIKDKKLLNKYDGLSVLVGVSVFKALKEFGVNSLSLKWPNDVYIADKKVCGLLLEGFLGEVKHRCIIVGVGINVNQTEFNGDFNAPPTSLSLEIGKVVDIKKLKKLVYKTIKLDLKKYKKGKSDYAQVFNENNYLQGKTVFAEINGNKTEVKCLSLNTDGTLNVLSNGEETSVSYGEITFHL